MGSFVISFILVFTTLTCSKSAPLNGKESVVVSSLTEICKFTIAGVSDQAIGTETLFYEGSKVDDTTVCRYHFQQDAAGQSKWSNYQQAFTNDVRDLDDVVLECKLKSGEIVRSCLQQKTSVETDIKKLPTIKLSRRLLSAESDDWKDTGSDLVSRGAVIGGLGGVILLVIVIILCAGKGEKEEPVKGVRISRLSSFQVGGGKVSMQDVREALSKCDSSTETGNHDNIDNRNSVGMDRNSLHVDGHVGNSVNNQPRPSSQVSTASSGSMHDKSRLVHTNGKSLERRLPEPPPNSAQPTQDDDTDGDLYDKIPEKDPNYDKVKDENDPNYSKVKDPDYEKIKLQEKNSDETRDPNYERVNMAAEDPAGASGGDDAKGDDLYAEVKGDSKVNLEDMYTKVDKDSKAKDRNSTRDSTASDDPYATVKGEDGAAPPVPVKLPDLHLENSPGPSPRQQRTASQGSTSSAGPLISPIDRPLPQQPTSSNQRKEPSYSEVSVRESIGSIKEREAKTKREMSQTYETVDELSESDVYYSTVKTTESSPLPPSSPPPPLPSDSTRPTSSTLSRDVGATLTVGSGNRASVTSDLYASIGDMDALPSAVPLAEAECLDKDDNSDGMPVYAQVNKQKRNSSTSQDGQAAGGSEMSNPMYSKVNKTRSSQSSEPDDPIDPQSQRSSKRSSDPGYARIKDLQEDTEPGYQAIDEVKGESNGEVMQSSDMVHISEHKVDENFWKKKDHMYQSITKDADKDNDDK